MITLPTLAILYIFSENLFFLNNNWVESIKIIQILIYISVVHSLTNNWKILLRSINKETLEFKISIIQTLIFTLGLLFITLNFNLIITLYFILVYKSLRFLFFSKISRR